MMVSESKKIISRSPEVLRIFSEINKIPRCSGNEKAISDWLVEYAKSHKFEVIQDHALNVIIKVPGKKELAHKAAIILQGHMDMVGVKEPNSEHDFTKDPIQMYEEDGWLKARGTTLGADNGIALAIALALATDDTISHPPLELVFTADEERGLTGANMLADNLLVGKYLLNLDSEDEGVFTIGCAGGRETLIDMDLVFEKNTQNLTTFCIEIDNLSGGHSGIQIGQQKPSALQMISRIMYRFTNELNSFCISDIKAGVAHNAIPTNATLIFSGDNEALVQKITVECFSIFKKEYGEAEKEMTLDFQKMESAEKYLSPEISSKITQLLTALPHGVFAYSRGVAGAGNMPETSNNLAQISITDDKLRILLSQRSSVSSQGDFITQKIESIAKLAGAKVFSGAGYPAWQPDWQSNLLKKSIQAYQNLFNKEPIIEVIHAGLECGVIGAKYPNLEMISLGPTIKTPHTPKERMKISDIDDIVRFLIELFKNI